MVGSSLVCRRLYFPVVGLFLVEVPGVETEWVVRIVLTVSGHGQVVEEGRKGRLVAGVQVVEERGVVHGF